MEVKKIINKIIGGYGDEAIAEVGHIFMYVCVGGKVLNESYLCWPLHVGVIQIYTMVILDNVGSMAVSWWLWGPITLTQKSALILVDGNLNSEQYIHET